jgi:predicted Zn-dependent protease
MQSGRFSDAVYALDWAHAQWPQNPWILNSRASALFELKKYNEAYADIKAAQQESDDLTSNLWSIAYPGNDPQIADEGLRHFKEAIAYNKHTIEKKINEQ